MGCGLLEQVLFYGERDGNVCGFSFYAKLFIPFIENGALR